MTGLFTHLFIYEKQKPTENFKENTNKIIQYTGPSNSLIR
jgi:hypothetical protein